MISWPRGDDFGDVGEDVHWTLDTGIRQKEEGKIGAEREAGFLEETTGTFNATKRRRAGAAPKRIGERRAQEKKLAGVEVMTGAGRKTMLRVNLPNPANSGHGKAGDGWRVSGGEPRGLPKTAKHGQFRPAVLRDFSRSRQTPSNAASSITRVLWKPPRWIGDRERCGHGPTTSPEKRPNPAKCGHDKTGHWWSATSRTVQKKNVDRCSSKSGQMRSNPATREWWRVTGGGVAISREPDKSGHFRTRGARTGTLNAI
jgi:hypothetical protein